MKDTVTLTGYLGRDPEIRDTRERTLTRTDRPESPVFVHRGVRVPDSEHDICEPAAEYDVTIPSREYAVLSLATHTWRGRERITTWHRLIVWNVFRLEFLGVRIARKGSKVQVTGRITVWTTDDGRAIKQLEVDELRLLELR